VGKRCPYLHKRGDHYYFFYYDKDQRRLSNWVSRGSIFCYPEVIAGRPFRMDCSIQALIVNPFAGGITCVL